MLMMITMPEGMPTSEHTPTSASPPQEADLLTLLRNQLEYYFSKDNLATDKYLCKLLSLWFHVFIFL